MIPFWRKILYSFIIFFITLILIFSFLEALLAILSPKGYFYPRFNFSEDYGHLPYPNTIIEHVVPPHKRIYTTNEYGLRGKLIPISNAYDKKNIIIFGDSYAFGYGVNDGDEFAAVMLNNLKDEFNVINTGVGGWGLTQQIRRFYEFGQLYYPKIVILVFCANDPQDNLNNMVTIIENSRFKFQKTNNTTSWIKKYLSKSILQKSNVYQVIRQSIYMFMEKRVIEKQETLMANQYRDNFNRDKTISIPEQFYVELLQLFANDLNKKGIKLLMISVNGREGSQLDGFPFIKKKVFELNAQGALHYIDINPWFESDEDFEISPVNHFDKRWNFILGSNLSKLIIEKYSDL